jgi:triphosphoribosyl-dephospho-CoA synthase
MLEVTAPKVGNVHRGADFDDVSLNDFLVSAVAIGPILATAGEVGVGRVVLDAVRATRACVGTNTNLGMILLLAPLAASRHGEPLESGVTRVLVELVPQDAADVYDAIALAQPGGLGRVEEMDIAEAPPQSLVAAMELAADRDLVARQYATQFHDVFHEIAPALIQPRWTLTQRIVHTHLSLIAHHGDTLIARKCGAAEAQEASDRAAAALASGEPGDENYERALADFDFWLRSAGRRRNPGTTADLIAAGLFVALRDGRLGPPWR